MINQVSIRLRLTLKFKRLFMVLIQYFRIQVYKALSSCQVVGKVCLNQPVLFMGNGRVIFKGTVNIGVSQSPGFLSTYACIDARSANSVITIEDGVWLNNNAFICSEGGGVFIGKNTLAGVNLEIMDSDFHNLDPEKRSGYSYPVKPVYISENVFIGSNVKILKGVTIGHNSVIAAGSIVTSDIPENVVAGGNPAKVIRRLK